MPCPPPRVQLRWVKRLLQTVRYQGWKAGRRASQCAAARDGLQHQVRWQYVCKASALRIWGLAKIFWTIVRGGRDRPRVNTFSHRNNWTPQMTLRKHCSMGSPGSQTACWVGRSFGTWNGRRETQETYRVPLRAACRRRGARFDPPPPPPGAPLSQNSLCCLYCASVWTLCT